MVISIKLSNSTSSVFLSVFLLSFACVGAGGVESRLMFRKQVKIKDKKPKEKNLIEQVLWNSCPKLNPLPF